MPRVPGTLDVITQPLYDSASIATAATSATFFQTPRGQGGKTTLETNMTLAGQLPSPWTFSILGLAWIFEANTSFADAKVLIDQGFFQLLIGAKEFLTGPLRFLPGGTGLIGFSNIAAAATESIVNNGVPSPHDLYMLTKPIQLLENENFQVTVTFPTAITLVATRKVWFVLHGELTRSVQ
jgi:hypothetical protein